MKNDTTVTENEKLFINFQEMNIYFFSGKWKNFFYEKRKTFFKIFFLKNRKKSTSGKFSCLLCFVS